MTKQFELNDLPPEKLATLRELMVGDFKYWRGADEREPTVPLCNTCSHFLRSGWCLQGMATTNQPRSVRRDGLGYCSEHSEL